ncbi:MAG: 7-cyano-7-deazaguanine synthase QueC [Gammaproteobacteria bacterium]
MRRPKAIVLLSGGLDSATVLAIAHKNFEVVALSFDYHQRHVSELNAAREIVLSYGAEHRVIRLDDALLGGSALTESSIDVPVNTDANASGIPVTYVPARNTIFLAHALAVAEVAGSADIFIGVNAVDYSGYPDCRPDYIEAFAAMANLATRAAVEGQEMHIHTPLINLSKAEIIRTGTELGVDYARTVSCYQADASGSACGECDSCRFRKAGFMQAGIEDPTRYFRRG